MQNELTDFAAAVNTVAAQHKGLRHRGQKLVSALSVKEAGFPRTSLGEFHKNLHAAIKAGLIRSLSDGTCLWLVVK